jgi:hypothetical protein
MAITAAFTSFEVPGASKVGIVEVGFSTTDYLTNGVDVRPAILAATGCVQLSALVPVSLGPTLTAGIADFSWDRANSKLKLYTSAAAECANALDISSIKVYLYVKGN